MGIETDFSVAANGDIRHESGTTNYTVLALHRFLQDLADNAVASGDDVLDITSVTPSSRSTDNIITLLGTYNIDDDAAKYLYDGSIKQGSGGTEVIYSGLRVLGAVNNTDTQLQVIQNNELYDGASPFWGDQSTGGYNGDAASGILFRCLIKSRMNGADIDGKRIRVQARHWGDTYDFFNVTLGEGESVAAIGTTPDAQNTTSQATVTAYTHVTNTEGYQTIDLNNGNGAQPYYSKWTFGPDTSGDKLKGMWEFIKDLVGTGTAKSLYGISGELFLGVTHQYPFGSETGNPFVENDIITWGSGSTAGSGLLLALNDAGATGTVWMQLLAGVAPTNGMTVNNEALDGTHDLTSAPTTRTVPKIFMGSYTGTLIGAFGVGVDANDLTASDSIQDLLGVTQTPPNNVTFTVSGLTSGEDYVLVGPKGVGLEFDEDQLSLDGNHSTEGTVTVLEDIPSDTPATGTIRLKDDNGIFQRIVYTSWTGKVFTLQTNLSGSYTDGADCWISYIDTLAGADNESFTSVYLASRDLFIRVRDGGGTPIKTYESPGTLGSAGGSAVASRISDE